MEVLQSKFISREIFKVYSLEWCLMDELCSLIMLLVCSPYQYIWTLKTDL